MKPLSFSYHGKNIFLQVQECKSIFSKIRGLMFRRRENSPAMLFDLKKPRKFKIHSLFVFFPFLTIWLDDKKNVLDIKIVKPFRFSVSSKKPFYKLLEIPINKKYSKILQFLVGNAKDL